jgi:hypothetical protein
MALRLRTPAPDTYRTLRRAFDEGHHALVRRDAAQVGADLVSGPDAGWVPGIELLAGLVAAKHQDLTTARALLVRGLSRIDGSAAAADIGDPSPFALALAEVLLLLGELPAAGTQADALVTPASTAIVRLGATRLLATVAMLTGRPEDAHHHLHTATALAGQVGSNLHVAIVEADRAVLHARTGKAQLAVADAMPLVHRLGEQVRGPHGRLAAATAATCGLEVARQCAGRGEPAVWSLATAGREAASRSGRPTDEALSSLTAARMLRTEGSPDEAAALAERARRSFEVLGCRVATTAATLEQGLIALDAGWEASAPQLLGRALAEAEALGITDEAGQARAALVHLA